MEVVIAMACTKSWLARTNTRVGGSAKRNRMKTSPAPWHHCAPQTILQHNDGSDGAGMLSARRRKELGLSRSSQLNGRTEDGREVRSSNIVHARCWAGTPYCGAKSDCNLTSTRV
jgi:hypothetical protein